MNNFQKYLSYITRIEVEKTSSEYNSSLVVAIQEGSYVLNAKNANYSFASLHRVFRKALKKVRFENINSVLILGCGAGSIPSIIYKELDLNLNVDAIEIDQKVVELGNKYFGLDQYSNMNVIVNDAMVYVESTDKKYDLILVDLFNGINVPQEFLTPPFFGKLKSRLNNDGQVLLNYVAYNHETKEQIDVIKELLTTSFSKKIKVYQLETINRVFHVNP